ncbi:acyltransferase family protein [Citrobacter portucalensis]|uniref:acyltransferase family protein n=1 Tax=Citrobacter portucalensis TaxID=1639133 RepID=UPI003EDFB485
MLLVIFGHLIEPHTSSSILFSDVYDFIYLFHMPAFIFLSGYLYATKYASETHVFYFTQRCSWR